ncbi:hypothetical protein SKDZ_11G1220 [Saccharomyces kudriavzevii ZP591]|nr:hypothetical protein SKDZ_11G1220 [Saccharomyces kudriavzevii ZP591]
MSDGKVNSGQNMNGKQGVNVVSSLPTTQVPVSILTNKEKNKSVHDESTLERCDNHDDQSRSSSIRRNIYKNDYSTNLRDFSFADLKQNNERTKDGHDIQINTRMSLGNSGQQNTFSPSLPSAVSFTVPEVERLPHHRYSISNKPGKQQQQEQQQKEQQQVQHQQAKQQEKEVEQIQDQAQKKQNERQQLIDSRERIANVILQDNTTNGDSNNRECPEPSDTDKSENEADSPSMEKNSIVHMPGDFIYFNPKSNTSKPMAAKLAPSSANSTIQKNKEVIAPPTGPRVPFTEFFQKEDDKKFHILIGATGSVATIKVPLIIDKLFKIYGPEKISIQLIVTKPAEHFLRGLKMSTYVKIWREEDAWVFDAVNKNDTSLSLNLILHHELRKWADIFLIAPLSANTLAKLANGICNNLLTSVMRDWSPLTPVLIAPAMNTFMYINPMTKKHLTSLVQDYPFIQVLKPVEKVLICGDIGMGGMREWTDIVEIVRGRINEIRKARDEETGDKEQEQEEQEGIGNEDEDEDDEEDEDAARNETASDESNDEDEDEDENEGATEV